MTQPLAMTRPRYIMRLITIAGLTGLVAAAFYIIWGAQLFSFYGWATAALVGSIMLSRTLYQRYTALGKSRWPRLLFVIPAVIACIVQIVYWLAFFNLGGVGIMLGQARLLILHDVGFVLQPAFIALLLLAAYLIWRGSRV
ncbi:MAG: hypothetical protein AAFV45_04315 [Pseudomonadota bacterium]